MATETIALASVVLANATLTHVEKSAGCYVCGQSNARGMQLKFEHVAPFTAEARTTALTEHEGWSGMQHGGVTFTLMDEALGWCLLFEGVSAVTAKIETRFLKPVPTGTPLLVRAWITADRRRLYSATAEVVADDDERTTFAEATATMMRVATERNSA